MFGRFFKLEMSEIKYSYFRFQKSGIDAVSSFVLKSTTKLNFGVRSSSKRSKKVKCKVPFCTLSKIPQFCYFTPSFIIKHWKKQTWQFRLFAFCLKKHNFATLHLLFLKTKAFLAKKKEKKGPGSFELCLKIHHKAKF